MSFISFLVGAGFGAVVLSTIPTTAKLINAVSPYAVKGLELILENLK